VQLAVFRCEGWDNSALMTIESNLAYSALDLLLGGKRGGVAARLDGRPFTMIETQLIKRMVEVVLVDANSVPAAVAGASGRPHGNQPAATITVRRTPDPIELRSTWARRVL
jgi:flagellar motor switch protein FliM